jgi:hypothetical protein
MDGFLAVVFAAQVLSLFVMVVAGYTIVSILLERQRKGGKPKLDQIARSDDPRWELIYTQAHEGQRLEGSLIWSRFSCMLIAHSILALLIASATGLDSEDLAVDVAWLGFLLILTGYLLCLAWWVITRLGVIYMDEWSEVVKLVERFYLQDSPAYPYLPHMVRGDQGIGRVKYPRPHDAQYATIIVFAVVYAGFLAWLVASV